MNAVNPSHYRGFSNGAEVIDIIEHLAANRANAIKYLARAGRKDDDLQDLSKALWYVAREILRVGGQEALDSSVKELPGEKTLTTNIPAESIERINTFNSLGDDEKIEGVVYKDKDGAFWTWEEEEWLCFDPDNAHWGWYNQVVPDGSYSPYTRTNLPPSGVA